MTDLVASAALALALGAGGWQSGYVVRYAPGVMQAVARHRHIPVQPCMVAWTAAQDRDIGATWLRIVGPAGRATCLVVDLPQPQDRPGLVRRQVLAELDAESGAVVCGEGWSGRAIDCLVSIMELAYGRDHDK